MAWCCTSRGNVALFIPEIRRILCHYEFEAAAVGADADAETDPEAEADADADAEAGPFKDSSAGVVAASGGTRERAEYS